MNKAVVLLLSFFMVLSAGVLFAADEVIITDSDDVKLSSDVYEMSLKIDNAKNKKEEIALLEEFAQMLHKSGQYAAAENLYKALLEEKVSKKKRFQYNVSLGDIYALQKNYTLSLDSYRKAEALYKKNLDLKLKTGDILYKSNLYNLAEQNFLEALNIDKDSDYAKRRLGDIYFSQLRYSKALEYYGSVKNVSIDKELVVNMALCYRSLDKTDEAIALTGDYLLRHGNDDEVFFLSGLLYADKRMYDSAEEQFSKSIAANDKNYIVYVYLAAIYMENDKVKKAKKYLDKAYSLNPSYSTIDLMYSEIAYKMGRIYEARRYAHNASLKAKTPFVKEYAQKMIDFLNNKKGAF